jgi:hypothetical protein
VLAKSILAIRPNFAICQKVILNNNTHKLLYFMQFYICCTFGITIAKREQKFENPQEESLDGKAPSP